MFDRFVDILIYGNMMRAFIVGILVSLCAALLGVSMVLRRCSMIGDGLSHVGFAALAIAAAANLAPLPIAMVVCVIAAFFLLRISKSSRINADAAIALVCCGALAIGVMSVSLAPGGNIDYGNYMFGSLVALTSTDTVLSVILSVVVIIVFVFFYNRIFAVTFDESFAKATGTVAGLYNGILSMLTAVVVVLGMRMMGALLISSLLIFPPLTSMRICKSYRNVVICSCVVSVVCFVTGSVITCLAGTPLGATIVCANIVAFLVFSLVRAMLTLKGKRTTKKENNNGR